MSGTISFLSNEFSAGEAEGQALIVLSRAGDLSRPVTVSYEITTDNATAGSDFRLPSGTVAFAAGESRAVVAATLIDDARSEPTETFIVSLTGVTSGQIGVPRTALVNILDDETPVVDPPQPPLVSDYDVTLQDAFGGLDRPLDFAFSPVDPDIVYIAEKGGRIRVYDLGADRFLEDFIDLRGQVNDFEDRGLMNIALHPDFPSQPYLYAYYVADPAEAAGRTGPAALDGSGNRYAYLSRFTAGADGLKAVPGSEVVLVGGAGTSYADVAGGGAVTVEARGNIDLPASDRYLNPADPTPPTVIDGFKQNYIKVDAQTHAGGALAFGPDGKLYVGVGDGTLPNLADPRTVSVQDLDSLAGKILRIDPITGAGLADNPFASPGVSLAANQSKVWQLGARNPFSMGFNEDGRLFITDTGWRTYEEINQGGPGANFGWPFFEGGDFGDLLRTGQYQDLPEAAAFYAAVAAGDISITAAYRAFAHANVAPGFQFQSITGGDAFVGAGAYPAELRGDYLVLDFTDGELFAVDLNDRRDVKYLYSAPEGEMPVFFSEGPDGFVWFADIAAGTIGRLRISEQTANEIELRPAKATYGGTAGADVYLVDSASDSTGSARDRIMNFNVAAGDRIDFTATGWDSGDMTFTRHSVGTAGEFNRVNGPGGFSLRVDGTPAVLQGGLDFGASGNGAPVAANDTASSTGAQVTINVLANDSDPDGDPLTVSAFDAVSARGGSVTRSGDALAYRPAAGFFGTDSFDYVLSDGAATDVGTVTVSVVQGRIVNLGPQKSYYPARSGADIYVVDSPTDSTAAARDRIVGFNVGAGDRVDFTPAGWDADDIAFLRFNVGRSGEFTRLEGPGGFSIRIDGPVAAIEPGLIFADDALL